MQNTSDDCFWNLHVLNHSLNVTFTLIALMTYIVFIIQQASFEIVDSQALLTSIRWLRNWWFGFCLIVESGNTKLNGTDVMGYQNDSSRFTSAPNISPNACLFFSWLKLPPESFSFSSILCQNEIFDWVK